MHKTFKVETDRKTYCMRVLNLKVMKREDVIDHFTGLEFISNFVNKNGILYLMR